MPMRPARAASACAAIVAACAGAAAAQPCEPGWVPLPPGPALDWAVHGMTSWEAGGRPVIVAGGNFTKAGATPLNWVGQWAASGWLPMADGVKGTVWSATIFDPDGSGPLGPQPVIGGDFKVGEANHVARWDGRAWQPLGLGMGGTALPHVDALTIHNGELIAGGVFLAASGKPAKFLARWDGDDWHPFPVEVDAEVNALRSHLGDLYVGGGVWDPAQGKSVGVQLWDGQGWSVPGNVTTKTIHALTVHNGELIAGGTTTVEAWDGASWTGLGGVVGQVRALCSFDPDGPGPIPELLFAGGGFGAIGGTPASGIAYRDGGEWHAMGDGVNGDVRALVVHDGLLYIGGYFTMAGGKPAPYFARWGCPPATCYADCDKNGTLDIDDFLCFQTAFAFSKPAADCDNNQLLNIDDFLCFQLAFALGC